MHQPDDMSMLFLSSSNLLIFSSSSSFAWSYSSDFSLYATLGTSLFAQKIAKYITKIMRIKPVKKILVVKIPRSAEVLQAFQLRFYVLDCVIAALLRSLLLEQKR
jgi:hypothetical protein